MCTCKNEIGERNTKILVESVCSSMPTASVPNVPFVSAWEGRQDAAETGALCAVSSGLAAALGQPFQECPDTIAFVGKSHSWLRVHK